MYVNLNWYTSQNVLIGIDGIVWKNIHLSACTYVRTYVCMYACMYVFRRNLTSDMDIVILGDPLMDIAARKSPFDPGLDSSQLWPATVTLLGSPPKAAMFFCTHLSPA